MSDLRAAARRDGIISSSYWFSVSDKKPRSARFHPRIHDPFGVKLSPTGSEVADESVRVLRAKDECSTTPMSRRLLGTWWRRTSREGNVGTASAHLLAQVRHQEASQRSMQRQSDDG